MPEQPESSLSRAIRMNEMAQRIGVLFVMLGRLIPDKDILRDLGTFNAENYKAITKAFPQLELFGQDTVRSEAFARIYHRRAEALLRLVLVLEDTENETRKIMRQPRMTDIAALPDSKPSNSNADASIRQSEPNPAIAVLPNENEENKGVSESGNRAVEALPDAVAVLPEGRMTLDDLFPGPRPKK